MNITIENTTFEKLYTDHPWAEGMTDVQVSPQEIENFLHERGYVSYNYDIFYDNMQSVWRWTADICSYSDI
jgi:hypothetical protein